MKTASYLIKPASSICNMNCQYCFYSDVSKQRRNYSKGIMSKETVEMLIDKALADAQEITFAFQGCIISAFRYADNRFHLWRTNNGWS